MQNCFKTKDVLTTSMTLNHSMEHSDVSGTLLW